MKITLHILQRILKNYCYVGFGKLLKNIFSSVPFKKFELSNLPTKDNYSQNWLHRKCFLFMLLEFSKLL